MKKGEGLQLKYVKGLSDKRIADLNKMGVDSAEDLIRVFPRAYLDLRKQTSLRDAVNNSFVLTKGTVVSIPDTMRRSGRFNFFKVYCEQDGELFTVIWFNQPYVRSKLAVGETYLFYGRVRNRYAISLTNPTFEQFDRNVNLKGIIPVYPLKGSLTQKVIKNAVIDALGKVDIRSMIPEEISRNMRLGDLKRAFEIVHSPENTEELKEASERIAIEEYFILIAAFKIIKGDRTQARINKYTVTAADVKEFSSRFSFEFTAGQKKAINDIFSDLKSPTVMNRLLQGDVGSGKTAVALSAIFAAVKSGHQAVMLAPTEVLARQNFALMQRYLPEYECVFLSGSMTEKEKRLTKEKISYGWAKIVVGTHAVLEKDVEFSDLSLCVCDEQQRFGVAQRNGLVEKGTGADVLIMSATPIPRTLSLVFYGDLDISTIPDKPAKRVEIQTGIVPKSKYDEMLLFVQSEINKGRQAYFVCPKIDGDDEGSVLSVTEIYDELSQKIPSVRVSLLHGRMKESEKTAIMNDFKEGRIDAVVSTTVIEVGIDVPNATVMVIYGADRFGLSQLHQLRGRVGRSDLKSYCFLLSDNENEKTIERLKTLRDNSDGFSIAEADYDERGGGDFMGTRQSGKLLSNLGGLKYSTASIFLAKKLADDALNLGKYSDTLRQVALKKYESLKEVTLN